jgi:5-formyltetrahydrofolate cyclo-ligase
LTHRATNPAPDPPHAVAEAKAALRAAVKGRLATLSSAARSQASWALCRHVRAWEPFNRAKVVLLFAPLPSEPDLSGLARAAIAGGKTVCVPAIDWAARRLDAVAVTDWGTDLVPAPPPAPAGVRVPRTGLRAVRNALLDVVIVPGLAFDRSGNRLGRGGGFYDRLLADATLLLALETAGVCFETQLVERVPTAVHDRPVGIVVTEKGSTDVRRRGNDPPPAHA